MAALTLPSVIVNYQKKVTVEKLKKAFSTFSQGLVQSQAENGNASEWKVTIQNSSYNDNLAYFEKYWKPYLKVIKICETMKDCGYKQTFLKDIKGGRHAYLIQPENVPGFIYGDGTYAYIRPYSWDATLMQELQILCLDLNGAKSPNIIGKDIFFFQIDIKNNVLKTMGDVRNCTKNRFVDAGRACAGKIIQDGWQIKDDYPW